MSRSRENSDLSQAPGRVGVDRAAFIARLHLILQHWPSADRLARATGVSPSAFRKWIRGEAEPSRERLISLAEAAGVSTGWLVSGEGPEPRLREVPGPGHEGPLLTNGRAVDLRSFTLLPRRPEAAAAGPESPIPPRGSEYIA